MPQSGWTRRSRLISPADHARRQAGKQLARPRGIDRRAEKIALRLLAAKPRSIPPSFGLDAFGCTGMPSERPSPAIARTIFSLSAQSIDMTNELSILRWSKRSWRR